MATESREHISVDASQWEFVLLRYPDGTHEILLNRGTFNPTWSQSDRLQAASIVLESILGEDRLIELNGDYEIVDSLEARFAPKAKKIQQLWAAFSQPLVKGQSN